MFLNLYPDMSRQAYTGNDTFVFAAPIPKMTWSFIYAMPLNNTVELEDGKIVIWRMVDDAIVMLRDGSHTDDDMLTAAARIRMVERKTNMIYAAPAGNLTQNELINRTAGAPRKLCKMLDIDEGDD